MDELRELILAHLDELHGTGLSDERYQLYTDMVYQCETTDKLIELAALEMQLEAHEFFMELLEQVPDLEEEPTRDDIDFSNTYGFGDSAEDSYATERPGEDNYATERPDENMYETERPDENNYVDISLDDMEDIDPNVLAMQKALLGEDIDEDIYDPSYYDIDALLEKGGSPSEEITIGPSVTYHDALADLLAAYPQDASGQTQDEECEDLVFDEAPEFSELSASPELGYQLPQGGFPSGFGQVPQSGFGQLPQSGFGQVPQSGFGQLPQSTQSALKQPLKPQPAGPAFKPSNGPAFNPSNGPAFNPQAQRPVQTPQGAKGQPQQKTAFNVFSDFSRRKS